MAPKKKGKGKKKGQRTKAAPSGGGREPAATPEPLDRGQLVGLQSRADLNGRRVEVRGLAAGKDGAARFRVELLFGAGAGTVMKVKAANLELDKNRMSNPAMATLVEAMQALAPGAVPEEERPDWAGLPEVLLMKVAETHVAQTEVAWAAFGKKSGASDEEIQEQTARRKRDGNCCLFVFAMVCKEWRKAQLKVGGRLRTRVMSDVILPGRVALAKWALAEGCPRAYDGGNPTMAEIAAEAGHRELVQWLCGEGGFAMDEQVMQDAAGSGDLQLVQWLRGEGCSWDGEACAEAAQGGHLKVLQWLRANGCPWDADTCSSAAAAGHLATLRWARENGCDWNAGACEAAAQSGHLEVLQWLRTNGCPWDARTCRAAALDGHLAMLRWARENGCDWNAEACSFAAEGDHLEVLQWLRAHGCPWDAETCGAAAHAGHLETLRWAHENGCEWDETTCPSAAAGGHLQILQWLRAHGCPWDQVTCNFAARAGHLETLRWAHENGCEWDEEVCVAAARGGHLEVLQWLRAEGCPWDFLTCRAAVRKGHVEVLRWARKNGCEWDAATRDWAAAELGYTDNLGNLIEWADDEYDYAWDSDEPSDEYSDDE